MESRNGALYWTGRVVEADIDLCGGPGWISCARGCSWFSTLLDRCVCEVESTRRDTGRSRDRTDGHVAMDRAQAAWPAGDLYRCAPCQGGAQDADQQE